MLINANALSIPLAAKSVHTVVTSPPYYGLRDYGTAKWEGGDPECEHTVGSGDNDNLKGYVTRPERDGEKRQYCQKCGAIRIDEQIGLEVTPDEYIANLVDVFRECKRILRDDGTLWVNIGDSYARDPAKVGNGHPSTGKQATNKGSLYDYQSPIPSGLKPKDLIGIPWMLAFALRADGWYLRQDIIWAKPNPMPESVKDRCTKSHEYIFLLSKSAKYYYDSEAVKEESVYPEGSRKDEPKGSFKGKYHDSGLQDSFRAIRNFRNKRDVWTVTTKPYKGAHYATFNPELIKPCILAGAPETCCAKCGAPYERIVNRVVGTSKPCPKTQDAHEARGGVGEPVGTVGKSGGGRIDGYSETLGYQPTCDCNAGTSSGIVFDPFVGSGTTVATAIQLGRKGIGIDLSFKYLQENAKARVESAELPLLNFIEQ